MSSYQLLSHSNQVRDSSSCSSSSNIRHGFSKSQLCLQKILQIIASYPPRHASAQSSSDHFDENRVLGIDLNMELCPWPEADPQESESLSASSVVVDNNNNNKVISSDSAEKSSSEGECDPVIQQIRKESETTNLEIQEAAKHGHEQENENEKQQDFLDCDDGRANRVLSFQENRKSNDCLSLLIQAAEMVSGNLQDINPTSQAVRHGGAISPVARSKRGRSHVLPSRYRDSVFLEPWKRLPRPQKLAAAAAATPPLPMVSAKRGKLNNNKQSKRES
ncbi:uncharacterized protein LOC8267019 [Ricinus communis]|uniref:uncharacterized protein LOC8267019 n=1 Tax=Ricinus communis TaxID=3988 RepID=UPI00201A9489|nr:uncharacterized protein LOC8267019 [Ricinus communis]